MTLPGGSGARIGYARVSTPEQDMSLQIDALERAGCSRIFQDVASGAKAERKGLDEALAYLRPGDTLVVWKIDKGLTVREAAGALKIGKTALYDALRAAEGEEQAKAAKTPPRKGRRAR